MFGTLKSNVIFSDTSLQKEVGGRKAHTIKRQRVKRQVSHGCFVVISGLLSFSQVSRPGYQGTLTFGSKPFPHPDIYRCQLPAPLLSKV